MTKLDYALACAHARKITGMCTCTSSQLRLGARRARRSCRTFCRTFCRIFWAILPAGASILERRRAGDARHGERSATASSASDEPSAGQALDDHNLYRIPFLAVCRLQPAADEVPAGAGASSPSRRSSRRAGERSQRPGSDWPSMMVLCWCRKKRMPLSKKRKASQLAKRLGWAMPHASGRAGTLSGRSALAMMKRGEQRASDENWRWRAMDVGNYARGAELTGGRSRPGLGGEGGPTQGSGRSGHLPNGGAR